ncbi:MAG: methionyl-tRNA formyltransferase [Calditrichia bacterium]
MSSLRVVFMGTPDFAVPALQKISRSHHKVVGVVSQPDRPRGRGQELIPTPVKKAAQNLNLHPILQPEKLKDPAFLQALQSLNADIFVVVAFRILPELVFSLPTLGTINLHPSLLPKYRGAAPLNWTIINGETESGITIIRISREIDAGGILLQEKSRIFPDETAGSLHDRFSERGAELLLKALDGLESGNLQPLPQNDMLATPAPKISKEMCRLSFKQPAGQVKNWIHGLSPHPAAFAELQNIIFKFYRAEVVSSESVAQPPGTILSVKNQITVSCSPGVVRILELQRQGKKIMSAEEFLRGFPLQEGRQFH